MAQLVAPSILASDFGKLDREIALINESEADWIHCDIMDGRFVPNISFGFPVLKAVKAKAQKPLDVHLMIVEPDKYINAFRDVGADVLTVHLEAVNHLDRTIHAIKEAGMKAGVAVNPATPLDGLKHVLGEIDLALIMTVNPGFGGQKFIPYSLDKVRELRKMIDTSGSKALIEVDGGVDAQTAPELAKAGTDVLVAGSYVFRSDEPLERILTLKRL